MTKTEAPTKLSRVFEEWPEDRFDIQNYLEIQKNGKEYVVSCAIGALYVGTRAPKLKGRALVNWAQKFRQKVYIWNMEKVGQDTKSIDEFMLEHLESLGLTFGEAREMEDLGMDVYDEEWYNCPATADGGNLIEAEVAEVYAQKKAKEACVDYLKSKGM